MGDTQGRRRRDGGPRPPGADTDGFARTPWRPSSGPGAWGRTGSSWMCDLTADGAMAVHHEPGHRRPRPDLALPRADLPAHVPLLAEALAVCEGMMVNIEIKNDPGEPDSTPPSWWRPRRPVRSPRRAGPIG